MSAQLFPLQFLEMWLCSAQQMALAPGRTMPSTLPGSRTRRTNRSKFPRVTSFEKSESAKSTDKSMSLQELMHFFGQLSANPFRGSDFVHRRSAQAIHRAELPQQQILAVLTHTGAIIKNAFADSLFHEQLMIRVGEAMRLVANTLKQPQGTGVHRKLQRQRPARPINFLPFLGQADDGKIVKA